MYTLFTSIYNILYNHPKDFVCTRTKDKNSINTLSVMNKTKFYNYDFGCLRNFLNGTH